MMELLGWKEGLFNLDPPPEEMPTMVSLLGTELVLEYNAKQVRSTP